MYPNPFIYKRPLRPGQDDLVTIKRETLLAKAISGLEFGHWYHVGGGKKIGKTSFLLALVDECRSRKPNYRFILVEPEELTRLECGEIYRVLDQRLQALQDGGQVTSSDSVTNLESLKRSLAKTTHGFEAGSRIVIVLDGIETLPREVLQELFRALLHVNQCQAIKELPGNFQFIVSGTLNTYDLQIDPGHSLGEHTMRFFLEDFRCEDIEDMLQRAAMALELECDPGFGRLLYENTGGTGYLVQKICYRILETAFLRREPAQFTLTSAEAAIDSILKEGETNVEMLITQIEKDHELVGCLMRTLRAGSISSTKFEPNLKALVAWGALSEQNGFYRVRNRFYETAFQDYFTTERLANLYFSQQKYDQARELFAAAASEGFDTQNALLALLGNLNMISANVGQENLARNILQAFMNVLDNTKNCSLMIPGPASGALRIVDAIGMNNEDMRSFELQVGQGIAGWVAQTGRFRIIRDVTDEIECPDFAYRDMALRLNFRAMASLPLKVAGKVMGVVNLCLGKPRQFSNSETRMLEALAAYASLALQNAQFHLEVEQYQSHIELAKMLIQDASRQTELKTFFKKILAAVGNIVGVTRIYLVYRKHEAARWQFILGESEDATLGKLPDAGQGEGIAGHVLQTGMPYFIENTKTDARYFAVWPEIVWELAVPCLVDGVPNGCLVVAGRDVPRLSSAQTQFLAMLAEAMAIALKNRQLYYIAEKQTQKVITARSIGEALSHENSLQEILNLIASECLNVVGHEHKIAFVWLKDRERGKLILKATDGEPFGRKFLGKSRSLKETSLITWVLETGLPCLVEDVSQSELYQSTHPDIKSELAVPLIFREETIGVLDVQSTRLNDFDAQDLDVLTAVSHNATVAAKIGELRDLSDELKVLYHIGTEISSSLKVTEVLRTICREGLRAPGFTNRSLSLQLIDPETGMPSLYVRQGFASDDNELCASSAWPHNRCQLVVQNKTHYVSPEVASDPLYTPSSRPVKSAVFVPIIFDHRVSGVMTMESNLVDDFGEAELRFLYGLANQAGVTIEKARLSENLAKVQMGVTKALEAAAIEEAVAGFTHDIKNLSAMIAGETQWLERMKADNRLNFVEIETALRNIDSYVKRIEDFSRDLKSRAYKEPPELRWCDLHGVIEEATYLIAGKARRQNVELQKHDAVHAAQLYVDPERLVRAFFNIMANALDAMSAGGSLRIDTQIDEAQIRISFSDTGPGISEENLNKVFQPFFTTKKRSYGLGLVVTKRIIETDHHGKLFLHSRVGEGTTVIVQLPANLDQMQDRSMRKESAVADLEADRNVLGSAKNILVVNDDSEMLKQIVKLLESEGYAVTGTESGKDAVDYCKARKFDAIVLDYHLKKDSSATQTAVDFVPELKKNSPATPIILTSASIDQQLGVPEVYCDFFLEINQSFWRKILDLVNNCLRSNANWVRLNPIKLVEE